MVGNYLKSVQPVEIKRLSEPDELSQSALGLLTRIAWVGNGWVDKNKNKGCYTLRLHIGMAGEELINESLDPEETKKSVITAGYRLAEIYRVPVVDAKVIRPEGGGKYALELTIEPGHRDEIVPWQEKLGSHAHIAREYFESLARNNGSTPGNPALVLKR